MPPVSRAEALRPSGMGPAGVAVWGELTSPCMAAVDLALAAEAARIADRLSRLDAVLTGTSDEWLRLIPARDDSTEYVLRVTGAMQEARQQAVVLKQIRAEIMRGRSDSGGSDDREDDILADL